MMKHRRLRCSFCRKDESEVSKLVAGPQVYICDACVAIASRLMDGDSHNTSQQQRVEPSVWRTILAHVRALFPGGNARRALAASD